MDFYFFLFLCVVSVWLYYPSLYLLELFGDIKFLERQRIYWEFTRLINCLFLSASLVSLYQYIFGEWSIFEGWNVMTETDFAKEANGVFVVLVLVLPLGNLILSMVVLSHSYKKIKNPRENILPR